MPFLLTDAKAPLQMETVPALKLTHFCGRPARDEVYAYLRCFVCRGALHLCFTEFDEAPAPAVRFGFALQPANETQRYLFLSVSPDGAAALHLYDAQTGAPMQAYAISPFHRTAGSDEQGVSWSAEGVLPAEVLRAAFGESPKAGSVWAGNVFLYSTEEPAFGAAFPVEKGQTVPTAEGFDVFTVVPY